MAEKPVTVDMTIARSIEPIPPGIKCLVVVSGWELGNSASGAPKVHIEMTVLEPEQYKSRKFFDDINLVNENTLGRLVAIFKALGYKENDIKVKKFVMPTADTMEGSRLCVTSRIVKAAEGSEYGDKSIAANFKAPEAYKES